MLGVVTFVTLRVVQVDETRLQQCSLWPVAHLAPSPRTLRPILSSFLRHAPEQNGAVPSQRQVGSIFQGDSLREVFLGTLVLGDETRAFQYGRDTQRDIAGYVERIGPNRWRLIMPQPHFESQMDVMELVPAS